MKKIIIDLYGLDENYIGGVSRFSIGLTDGLIKNISTNNIEIICSTDNSSYIKKIFPNVKQIIAKKYYFDKYIHAAVSILAWALRQPSILKLTIFYRRININNSKNEYCIIVPTSTMNFYHIKCDILCIHDIQHEIHPKNFTIITRAYRWAQYRYSSICSRYIQVSSDYIRNNLMEIYGEKISQKTIKLYEGFSEEQFSYALKCIKPKRLNGLENNFLYYPAQLWKHKNHQTVIEGLRLFNEESNLSLYLVLTGVDYGQLGAIENLANENNIRVYYLGKVPDIEMRWLYRNAIAVISAGYHESSSLPIREALACLGNILAASIPPNKEINFIKSIHFFDTFSPFSFSQELKFIYKSRNKLENNELINSQEIVEVFEIFEWKRVAKKYLQIINGL